MSRVIISQFDLQQEHISRNTWNMSHNITLINEEDIPIYLSFLSHTEGYTSVRDYLRHNPLWKYSLDGGSKVVIT